MSYTPNTVDTTERTGPNEYRRLNHRYLGFVRDNLDPERKGRVRVHCPEVMGEVDNSSNWLGWAQASASGAGFDQGMFMVPTMPSDNPRDNDSTSPYNQTRVWITFRDGDPSKPVYDQGGPWIGGELILNHAPVLTDVDNGGDESIAKPNGTASTTKFEASYTDGALAQGLKVDEPVPSSQAAYPRNNVWKTSGGSIFEVDDTPGGERIKVFHPSGSYIEINQAGTAIQRTTGKKIDFVSDERFSTVVGPSTEIYNATQHLQVDRSSVNIYRGSRLVVTEKGEKRYNRASVSHNISGLLDLAVGSYTLESTGNVDLIAAADARLGGEKVILQGTSISAASTTGVELIGQASGVSLVGSSKLPTHPLYASIDIDTTLAPVMATFDSATVALAAVLSPLGPAPPPSAALLTWVSATLAAMKGIQLAFLAHKTVHTASKV